MPFADREARAQARGKRLLRLAPAAMLAGVMATTLASTTMIDTIPIAPISPLSLAMLAEAERLAALGEADAATGYFETALAADPRNAAAFVGLARIARGQSLTGKAIAYFREALALEPDNRIALSGEGEALVARGAIAEARGVAARLRALCGQTGCEELAQLESSFAGAGERTVLSVEEVTPLPRVEAN
jgi:tetratricopeptide (TPR) repeat protein